MSRRHQDLLAQANALRWLSRHRHHAPWEIAGIKKQLPLFGNLSPEEVEVTLPKPTQAEHTLADCAHTRLNLDMHPQMASAFPFLTREDEHGMVNVIVWRDVIKNHRRVLLESELLGVDGRWEAIDGVCHPIAGRLIDMIELLGSLDVLSRDFH
jgi:error-prone DNA polymerase